MASGNGIGGWIATGAVVGALVGAAATGLGFLLGGTAGIVVGAAAAAVVTAVGGLCLGACPWETQPAGSVSGLGLSYLLAGAVTTCAMTGHLPSFSNKAASAPTPVTQEFNDACKAMQVTIGDKKYTAVPEGCITAPAPKKTP